jgi:hypothetical protein
MINTLLPARIDNTYRGHRLALWLLGVVLAVKIFQSIAVIFNGRFTLVAADGIPLDRYTPAGAQTIVSVWALLALVRLIIFLLGVIALMRYRSAVPVIFVVLMVEYLSREVLLHFIPLIRVGSPPGPIVHLIMFALTVVGLPLSLWNRGTRPAYS